ncbi:MAG: ABC transporter permease [Oceanospirillaceae bacterium]|nr:ABC transporter permease [Oceanospirillaceae bacterium]
MSQRLALSATTKSRIIGVFFIVFLLLAWEAAVEFKLLKVYKFPPPSMLWEALTELFTSGFPKHQTVDIHIAWTLWRILQGYLLGCFLAIPLGVVIGSVPILDKLTAPIITFGRSIAALSLLPLVIFWFGTGEAPKIAIIAYGAFWAMIAHTIAAVKFVDPLLIRAARTLEASHRTIFLHVIIPAALPRIFTGARVALGVAFMVIVGAEMIGTIQGLGALINEARNFYRADITLIGMVLIGLLGLGISGILQVLERVLLPWNQGLEGVRR